MSTVVLICRWFHKLDDDGYTLPEKELLVDWAYDKETEETVVVPCDHPCNIGGVWDDMLKEWVIR